MIKLGDRITVKPATFDVPGKDGKPKAIPGTVVYVHPGGRYTVEPEPENRYAELHFSDEDVYILACLVYHEARGESFEGQVAVVEVVLNRMLSDYFPDTVEEVVFQKYGDVWQFSPAPYLYSAEPDKEQYLAVHTAIEEREHILSEDTVYFSTAPYNESVDMIIGNHYFCKIF